MRERKSGSIVQITSVGGITTGAGFGVYCAAKHALEGLSECLSLEVQPFGIRVLIVEPGAFRTESFGSAFQRMPVIDAYVATSGATRAWVKSAAGKQAGDPLQAAVAIVETVARAEIPLRLPLGPDAIDLIRAKLAFIGKDVDAAEPAARAAVFEK